MLAKKGTILFAFAVIVITLCFLTFSTASAAPINNFPVTVTQPDGTVLHLLASGDEFYNWLHDEQGFTILQDPHSGYYVYANLVNGELVPTKSIVGKSDPAKAGLEPFLNISSEKMGAIRSASLSQTEERAGEIEDAPKTGTITNLMIFIRFSDESEFADQTSKYTDMLNSSAAGANSLRNYYREVSYNALTIDTLFFPTPGINIISYKDGHPRSYYRPYNAVTNPGGYTPDQRGEREQTLLRDAVNYISGLRQFPAAGAIDGDGDGVVDSLTFVVSGGSDGWNDLLWPHAWVMYIHSVTINGKSVQGYQFQLQSMMTNGVLAHETFHVLGGPDLYHYTRNGIQPVGGWDVMEYDSNPPQHMGCYMKYKYGNWISSLPVLTTPGTYTLNPLTSSTNNCKKIASPNSDSEFFVVEYRSQSGSIFENSLPGSGLLVYRINSIASGNASGPPDEIYIYRPGGTLTLNGNINSANFSSNVGRTSINDTTNPSSFLSDGRNGGLNICNITSSSETISFDICNPGDTTPPSGGWTSPSNGQTVLSRTVTLSVSASDNAGGSGVKEVRFSAMWDNAWRSLGTVGTAPYLLSWDMCSSGVPDGDIELGFEVWDKANNKWVYSEHYPNYHIRKSYDCTVGPDTTPPTGSWTSPTNGQTIGTQNVILSVNASDNPGGSGVREVRWSAKWNDQWSGIGVDNTSPYSIDWDMCASGVPNGDIELGMEVWDNASNKWVYSEHFPNYHINKSYDCTISSGGWETWGWQNKYLAGYENWHGTITWENNYPYIWWDFGTGGPFNWGGDEFSLRMQKNVYFPGGDYTFHTQHDDGIRVYIDGSLLIDAWWDGSGSHDASKNLLQGYHQVKVEYYEGYGDAFLHVFWYGPGYPEPDIDPPDGLITSPSNHSAISSSPLGITADAWDDVSGVDRVEFYVWACDSTCSWRLVGTDPSEPYAVDWDWSSLYDQHVYLTIHVIDKSGKVTDDPGGFVEVDLDRTNPAVNITSPLEGDNITGVVPVMVSAEDNLSGIWGIEFIVGYNGTPGSNPQDLHTPPAPARPGTDGQLHPSVDAGEDYWREIGWDFDGSDGWSFNWDTSGVPEQSGAAVFVYAFDEAGNYEGAVSWNLSIFETPANDDFDSPIPIDSSPYHNQQSVFHATSAADDPALTSCNRSPGSRTVWYEYTPPTDGQLSVSTAGSDYDTMLAVWTGSRGDLHLIGCNDDNPLGLQSDLYTSVIGDTRYYIEVAQYTGYIIGSIEAEEHKTTGESNEASSTNLQFNLSFDPSLTISGNTGVGEAVITSDNGIPEEIISDKDGSYRLVVPYDWSGTITPSKTGYTFMPSSRTYVHVRTHQVNQNYVATPGMALVSSIVRLDNNPTGLEQVNFKITFTLPVTGVDITDFILTNPGVTGAWITNVRGSGTTYTAAVTTGSGNGTIRLDVVDNDSIQDADSEPLGGIGTGNGNFEHGEAYTITQGANITIGTQFIGNYPVLANPSTAISQPNMVDGPVRVKSARGGTLITSERAISGTSFNEVMGYPTDQLTTEYWFPWYDNLGMTTWVLVGNASISQEAKVEIYIGGVKRYSSTIQPGGRVTPRFSLSTGPVRVVSTNGTRIFTSERSLYKGTFNEVMGYPANQFTTEYWFPWYDNVGMAAWVLVGNPTTSTAKVDIYVGASKASYSIPPKGSITPRYPGKVGGPVRVVSTNGVKIFSSERSLYGDSFNEVMGYPGSQLTTEYWFPWYDNVGMDTWVLVGNPTTSIAKVDIYVNNTRTSYTIQPGGRITPRFVGMNTGPVRVVSTNGVKIFTSERVIYGTSFNEVMGYAGNRLSTEYWFPWYDSATMSTDILVSRP